MRKITIVALCLVLVLTLSSGVLAAGVTMNLSTTKTTISRGESIVVTVSVSEFEACTGGSIRISYDSSVFERSGNEWLLTGTTMAMADGDAVFAYGSSSPKTISGDIYQFTLTAKSDAPIASSSVTVNLELKNADGSVYASQNVSISIACSHSYDNDCDSTCNICGASRTVTHSWDSGTVTTAPTCSSTGVRTYTCTVCGETKTETISKTGHTWNGGTVTKEPTCTEDGMKTYTCTGCGETRTETVAAKGHVYSNSCDSTCNTCGATRAITHSYKTAWSSDGTGHWHECSVCGQKKDEAAHTPGPEATEDTPQTCTVCGYILHAALDHVHDFGDDWQVGTDHHWHGCSGCEEEMDLEEHVYDNPCDADCNVCLYVRDTEHIYDIAWKSDGTGHWHACTVCGEKADQADHTLENGVCTVCGCDLTATEHTHDFGDQWMSDANNHWQECTLCGESNVAQDHTWDGGKVTREPTETAKGLMTYTCTVCGAEKQMNIAKVSTDVTTSGEFPWWLVAVAAGALVVGCSLFLFIGIAVGKKKTGKYSPKEETEE